MTAERSHSPEPTEPDALAPLGERWDEAQHHARCLTDFQAWRRTPPGRRKLFDAWCRHAVPAEWDRFLASGEPPFIFPSQERYLAHMEHCQLCGAQLQLAEIRRRRAASEDAEWEDQMVLDFYARFCGVALAAVCDPREAALRGLEAPTTIASDGSPWRIEFAHCDRASREGRQDMPVKLIGPPRPASLEVIVSAQLIRAHDRQAQPPQFLLGGMGEGQPFSRRPGDDDALDLHLPAPQVREPGRLILRYAVIPSPAEHAAATEIVVGAATRDETPL